MRRELFDNPTVTVDLGQLPNNLPEIKKGEHKKLTTAQTEFNRLNKKIAAMKKELLLMPEKRELVERYYNRIILPRRKAQGELLEQAIYRLDEMYDKRMVAEKDLFDLSAAIYKLMEQLDFYNGDLSKESVKRLEALWDKHERIQSKLSKEEFDRRVMDDMLVFYMGNTGNQPTAKMRAAKSPEELEKLVNYALEKEMKKREKAAEEEEGDPFEDFREFFAQMEQGTSHSGKKQKKMTQAALKRQQLEEQTRKSIHTIYKELAKTLHPDLESDAKRRAHKEEQMKQLTEAYKKNDLATLLTMRLTWLEESSEDAPYAQSDDLLKGYNKVLKEQLKSLEQENEQVAYSHVNLPEALCRLLLLPYKKLVMEVDYLAQDAEVSFQSIKKGIQRMTSSRGVSKLIRESRKERIKREAGVPDEPDPLAGFLDIMGEVMEFKF